MEGKKSKGSTGSFYPCFVATRPFLRVACGFLKLSEPGADCGFPKSLSAARGLLRTDRPHLLTAGSEERQEKKITVTLDGRTRNHEHTNPEAENSMNHTSGS